MLLTRSLPLRFLLPAWGARPLWHALQRAHISNSSDARPKWRKVPVKASAETPAAEAPTTFPTRSLFDELFPEESKEPEVVEEKTVEKLPAFEWNIGPKIDWSESVRNNGEVRKDRFHAMPKSAGQVHRQGGKRLPQFDGPQEERRRREASVLVLNCASKTLEESDFFRVGSKGEHIEGWTSGIIKVIQARDSTTLEPLGHYFILFSSEGAARAYVDQTVRLHTLSRTHTPTSIASSLPTPPRFLREDEDLDTVLRAFSLVPGHSKLSLRHISRPYRPAISRILSDGGPAAIASRKLKAENMVLFSVDVGRVSHHDLQKALGEDGRRRNLQWKLVGNEDALVRIDFDQQEEEEEVPPKEGGRNWEVARTAKRRPFPKPARYLICFQDAHEARRFVREWHRRPFPWQNERSSSNESPTMVNAEILW